MRPYLALLLVALSLGVRAQSLSFSDEQAPSPRAKPADEGGGERRVLDELASLDRQIQAARAEIDGLGASAAQLEATRARHQAELDAINAEISSRKAEISGRVRALYKLHRRGLARVIFGAEDPVELLRRARYLVYLVRAETGPLRDVSMRLAARKADLDQVAADEAQLAAAKAAADERERSLTEERAARLTLLDDLRTKRELALAAEAELGQTRSALTSRLSGGEGTPSGGFRSAFGRLPWPASGRLLRRFGAAPDPATGRLSSMGIDLSVPTGTAIRAVFDGTVSLGEVVPGYGLTVALSHGPYTTVYGHASKISVRRGEPVQKGQTIAVAGNTGLADETCCTLTFELRYNGTPQDPLPWLAR